MAEENYEDRRSATRVNVVCPVTLKGAVKEYHGLMRNVSLGGAAIEGSEELPDKKQYVIEFALPDGPELKCECEIMWAIRHEKIYMYGVRFLSVGMFGKMKLKSYIERKVTNESRNSRP